MKSLIFIILSLVGIDQYKDVHKALDMHAGIPKSDSRFVTEFRTPKGVLVVSVAKKKDIPAAAIEAIEQGAQMAIDRKLSDWPEVKTLRDVRFYLIQPSTWREGPKKGQKCTNEVTDPGSPCLTYKGIQTAGTVMGIQMNSPLGLDKAGIVLPVQTDQNWGHLEYLKNSAWFEGEHFVECKQGRNQPVCLYYQVVEDAHPHRAEPPAPAATPGN